MLSQHSWHATQAKTEGGKIIRVEAHPIPEHPRPHRCRGRVALVGDAAGYVTKCSGEGIYFAAKSGRMAAEAIVAGSQQVRLYYRTDEAIHPSTFAHKPARVFCVAPGNAKHQTHSIPARCFVVLLLFAKFSLPALPLPQRTGLLS